jgi:DNA-binding MarR family transcriptional regulator
MTDAEPRWLDDAEMQAWLRLLRVVMLLPGALDRQLRQDAGLTHASYMVLACLSDAPDRSLRMSELARVTATSQSRLSHSVASLEQRGWVQRRPCPQDGRGQVATLTDAGVQVLVDTAPGHVAKVRSLVFDALGPDELEQLSTVAGRLAARLEADSSQEGGVGRSRGVR